MPGSLRLGSTLQSLSHEHIFAAGDIAALKDNLRPKSGVYAVRAGPVLADNLRRFATGRRSCRWRPQSKALALSVQRMAKRWLYAETIQAHSRAGWWLENGLIVVGWQNTRMCVWHRHSVPRPLSGLQPADLADTKNDPAFSVMRCLGCGAKTSHENLSLSLQDAVLIARDLGVGSGIFRSPG